MRVHRTVVSEVLQFIRMFVVLVALPNVVFPKVVRAAYRVS